jgi:hypothetical protein
MSRKTTQSKAKFFDIDEEAKKYYPKDKFKDKEKGLPEYVKLKKYTPGPSKVRVFRKSF